MAPRSEMPGSFRGGTGSGDPASRCHGRTAYYFETHLQSSWTGSQSQHARADWQHPCLQVRHVRSCPPAAEWATVNSSKCVRVSRTKLLASYLSKRPADGKRKNCRGGELGKKHSIKALESECCVPGLRHPSVSHCCFLLAIAKPQGSPDGQLKSTPPKPAASFPPASPGSPASSPQFP